MLAPRVKILILSTKGALRFRPLKYFLYIIEIWWVSNSKWLWKVQLRVFKTLFLLIACQHYQYSFCGVIMLVMLIRVIVINYLRSRSFTKLTTYYQERYQKLYKRRYIKGMYSCVKLSKGKFLHKDVIFYKLLYSMFLFYLFLTLTIIPRYF